jgi:hypothetical protein
MEVAFDSIQKSIRHDSGFALRKADSYNKQAR